VRRRSVVFVAACVGPFLLLVGCTANVSGRVVGRTLGEPVAGARVTISGESTLTDGAGNFVFTGVDKSTSKGAVTASGFPETTFEVDLRGGDASSTVAIVDAVVIVGIKELAVEPREVPTATVTLDGQAVSIGQPVKSVVPGAHTLTIDAPGHESFEGSVDVVPGENSLVTSVSLTPLETYKRFWDAGQFHHDSLAYKYVHPDERKTLSLKEWKAWSAGGGETISVKWGAIRIHPNWKSPVTKKRYSDVAEIDRTEKLQWLGRTFTSNYSQRWAKVAGIWYILHKDIP